MPEVDPGPVREAFGRVVYSHKTHEKARELASRNATEIKWVNIGLTAVTSGSLVSALVSDERALLIVGALLSAASVAFTIFQLSFDPQRTAERHRTTANQLWYIREQYLILLADLQEGAAVDLPVRRAGLVEDLKSIYEQAPDTGSRAYRRAQKALKVDEDMTFTDAEIDRFLPPSLHRATDPPQP